MAQPRKQWSNGSTVASDKENEFEGSMSMCSADVATARPDASLETPIDAGRRACPASPTAGCVEARVTPPTLVEEPETPQQEPVLLELPNGLGADQGPVLHIAQFAACPWVDFGHVLMGNTAASTFTVKNPTGAAQTICARAPSAR